MNFHSLAWSVNLFYTFLTSYQVSVTGAKYVLRPHYDFQTYKILEYKKTNTLKCSVSEPLTSEHFILWSKDGEFIEMGNSKYETDEGKLRILQTTEEDILTYTCTLLQTTSTGRKQLTKADINTMGKPTAKIVRTGRNGAFAEGSAIKLECISQGNPKPHMKWIYNESRASVQNEDKQRVQITKHHDHSLSLHISDAALTDRGLYICRVWNIASQQLNITIEAKSFVRVKSALAIMWPFIGICTEIVVLFAIICIYERNRVKAEPEDSEVDIKPIPKPTLWKRFRTRVAR